MAQADLEALGAEPGAPPSAVGHVIEVYADFSGQGQGYTQCPDGNRYRITMDDLRDPGTQDRLRQIWTDPHAVDPSKIAAQVRLRDECLNDHIFSNLAEARKIIENWRIDDSTQRPHTSLGGLAPAVYANLNRAARPASLELRKGSAQRALTAFVSTERNRNGFYT